MLRLDINLLFTALNILIWFILIRKFLFKPVNAVISRREETIASRYAEAKKLQDEAQADRDKCAQFQAQLEEEKAKALLEAQEKAHVEYDRILREAQEKANLILENAKKEAVFQKEQILNKAQQEILSLIMDTAVRSMRSSSNDGDLYDQFLKKAGEKHAGH